MNETERSGPYMETIDGGRLYFLEPREEDISIEAIAASLANICRFNGHTLFYSVAEHSVYVASLVPEEHRLEALLHDAAEAYVGDISAPLKRLLPELRNIEKGILRTIYNKFGVVSTKHSRKLIKFADLEQLRKEAFYLMPTQGRNWDCFDEDSGVLFTEEDDGDTLRVPRCVEPSVGYEMFIEAFKYLTETTAWIEDFENETERSTVP